MSVFLWSTVLFVTHCTSASDNSIMTWCAN